MSRSSTRTALTAAAIMLALQPFGALAADSEDGIPDDGGNYHTDTVAIGDLITRAVPVAYTPARPASTSTDTVAEADPAALHW